MLHIVTIHVSGKAYLLINDVCKNERHLMRNIIRLIIILCLSMVGVLVSAQDDTTEPGATVLNCTNGEGCVRTESSLTVEEATIVLGENPPEGMESPYVVCADGMGCMWSHIAEDEADLVFGGDGIDDMVFDEDEGLEIITVEDMEFTEDEGTEVDTEEGLIFTEEEIAEFEDMLCNGAANCNWTDFSPEEIDALFPEFEGVAYLIVPREGEWQGTSHPPVLIGCPAGTTDALCELYSNRNRHHYCRGRFRS